MGQDQDIGAAAAGSAAKAVAAGSGAGSSGGARLAHGTGRKVLVIEDEPNISEAIRFILRRDGWSVDIHPTGEGALARLAKVAPDLLILDVMLPGQSGFDVLRALRAEPGFARLPVILLTARGQASTRELAHDHGASLFMPKPFANTELLAAVRQLVGV